MILPLVSDMAYVARKNEHVFLELYPKWLLSRNWGLLHSWHFLFVNHTVVYDFEHPLNQSDLLMKQFPSLMLRTCP
jgi:hypothetical protein